MNPNPRLNRTSGAYAAPQARRLRAPHAARSAAARSELRPAGITAMHGLVALVALTSVAALAGCNTPRGVPTGSSLVTEATVKSSFQAPADGMLWIFRTASRGARGQLHYSGPIAAGQVLVIDPSMNKATIDGQELELVLPGGDVWYQAYFRPDRSVSRVLADRPAGGRVAPDYRELDPAPAQSTQTAPEGEAPPRTE